MLSHRCAFCGNQTHFSAQSLRISSRTRTRYDREGRTYDGYKYSAEIAATCDSCHRYNCVRGVIPPLSETHAVGSIISGSTAVALGGMMTNQSWSPPSMVAADTEYLPEKVAGFYQEAHDAFSIGAYRSVLLLSRSVIEATAKANNAGGNNLLAKIDSLYDEGVIRPGTKQVAHALRLLGNDIAHGDLGDPPTPEDAEDVLKLVRMVLDDVYVGEAMTADILRRRGKETD